ncbi:hypothetical protein [Acidithiobacillus sp.]
MLALKISAGLSFMIRAALFALAGPFLCKLQRLRIGNIGRGDLVHHFGRRVAQHALGADVEQLNGALLVGGNTRKVGAVEYRVLQCPGFKQRLLAAELGDAIGRAAWSAGMSESGGFSDMDLPAQRRHMKIFGFPKGSNQNLPVQCLGTYNYIVASTIPLKAAVVHREHKAKTTYWRIVQMHPSGEKSPQGWEG